MSYNTRRTGGYSTTPSNTNVGNIGQRRPVVTNNFVPGGQLTPQKPQQQQPQQNQRPPQQNTPSTPSVNFRNQQNQQQTPQKQNFQQQQQQKPQQPVQQQKPPVQPVVQQQQQQKPQVPQQQQQQPVQQQQQQQQPVQQQQQQQQPVPQQQQSVQQQQAQVTAKQEQQEPMQQDEDVQMSELNNELEDPSAPKKKKFHWFNKGNKISKSERQRRRNLRLSNMLQPKNAVMILNELVKNVTYTVTDIPVQVDYNQYRATVLVDEIEHAGVGRSKVQAKNSAAETALRYLIKHKQLTLPKREEGEKKDEADGAGGEEQMEVTPEDANAPLPWQHIASFALFKLFSSWGEDPNLARHQQDGDARSYECKPAKKMPENPSQMNPLMLLNQMLPHAQFEEIGKSGSPPNVTFSFRCNVNGKSFVGTGTSKKAAKKMAAFGACHEILEVIYPPDVFTPTF